MTTEPDPRADLAGWLGLTDMQVAMCQRDAKRYPVSGVDLANLHAPKPPWKSPLDDLPDLTEEDCGYAVGVAKLDPGDPSYAAQIGRALIAAGWTPEEEA